MAALSAIGPAFWLAAAQVSAGGRAEPWADYIAEASGRFGIPQSWIQRVMRAESNGQTTLNGRPITSRAGAMGLMQLMPSTWVEMRAAYRLGDDPYDPHDNVLAGAAYLRAMYDRFGYPGAFAAYNAGPGRYAEHIATGRRLPAETIGYVTKLTGVAVAKASSQSPRSTAGPTQLFALQVTRTSSGVSIPQNGAGGLFAIRR
jgi:soluble lytic murein transglycosylase-like protein